MESQRRRPDPEILAKCFKFYRQEIDSNVVNKIPFERVASKKFYTENKRLFDRVSDVCFKYGIDYDRFIRFCVVSRVRYDPSVLTETNSYALYSKNLREEEQMRSIYDHFVSSADFVANESIRLGLSVRECLCGMITGNRLAYEYFGGNISKHYISCIGGFRKLYFRMDEINRRELGIIYEAYDELRCTMQDVFLKFRNRTVSAVGFTEETLKKKIQQENTKGNKLCAQ